MSRPDGTPHVLSATTTGLIKCDSVCERYQKEGFCGHAIGVAIFTKSLEKYAQALARCNPITTTKAASSNINARTVGRKKAARTRKRKSGSPEKDCLEDSLTINPTQKKIRSVSVIQDASSPISLLHMRNPAMFYGPIKDISIKDCVLSILSLHSRVSVCQGCHGPLKLGTDLPPPLFDLVVVTKIRREYSQNNVKKIAPPSNGYFRAICDNPFMTPFECVQRKVIIFSPTQLKLHHEAWILFSPKHIEELKRLHLFDAITMSGSTSI